MSRPAPKREMIRLGYQIKPTKKPILGAARISDVISVCNAILRTKIVEGETNEAQLAKDGGLVLKIKRPGGISNQIVFINGPATVYEEDGTTVHATVAAGQTYVLAIAYREVTESINGDCAFRRALPCSLPYKYT